MDMVAVVKAIGVDFGGAVGALDLWVVRSELVLRGGRVDGGLRVSTGRLVVVVLGRQATSPTEE